MGGELWPATEDARIHEFSPHPPTLAGGVIVRFVLN